MNFLLVVIREANDKVPGLEFLLDQEGIDHEERRRLLAEAYEILELSIPAVVDSADAAVEKSLSAWPERLVVVNRDGRIAFDAGLAIPAGLNLDQITWWLDTHMNSAAGSIKVLPRVAAPPQG